jgi:hypothetical protein
MNERRLEVLIGKDKNERSEVLIENDKPQPPED